jgi:serpin B
MKRLMILLVLAVVITGATLQASSCKPDPFDATDAATAGNTFALALYAELQASDGNLFFSPSSIFTALGMTYAGARGETAREMAAVLELPDHQKAVHVGYADLLAALQPDAEATHKLTVANRLWGQDGFDLLPEFLALVRTHYDGGYTPLDFVGDTDGSRRIINAWVEEKTEDKIKDLLMPGSIDANTGLVLTNAVYFHGLWKHAFGERSTADEPFFTMDDLDVEAPFMRMVEHLGLGKRDGFRVLELPYEQEELSFFVLLPDARDGLADLESRLDPATLDGWLTDLDMQRVRCILPRFRTTSRFELGKVLAGMGMKDAFSGSRADFSGITGRKDLAISDVVHKAFVDVFEAGTEAAAATAVVMKRMSISHEEPPVDFRADHPFLFLIRHRDTGAILFMGRLTDPS